MVFVGSNSSGENKPPHHSVKPPTPSKPGFPRPLPLQTSETHPTPSYAAWTGASGWVTVALKGFPGARASERSVGESLGGAAAAAGAAAMSGFVLCVGLHLVCGVWLDTLADRSYSEAKVWQRDITNQEEACQERFDSSETFLMSCLTISSRKKHFLPSSKRTR